MTTRAFQKIYTKIDNITKATVTLRALGVGNDELATVGGKLAQVVKIMGENVTLQVFAGTEGLATDSEVVFHGEPPKLRVSDNLAGRFFNAYGEPLEGGEIVEGEPRTLDLGSFNGRCFSYVASFGAFTRASYATSQSVKNALGHLAYVLGGIKELPSIRSRHVRFLLDHETVLEDDYIFGAISNSTSVAGILTLSPEIVDMNDGVFELLLVRKPQSLMELSDCVLALTTQDYHTPMLTFTSASHLEIDAPADMDWTLDGEQAKGQAHCVAENLHNAVRVIVNPATDPSAAE